MFLNWIKPHVKILKVVYLNVLTVYRRKRGGKWEWAGRVRKDEEEGRETGKEGRKEPTEQKEIYGHKVEKMKIKNFIPEIGLPQE